MDLIIDYDLLIKVSNNNNNNVDLFITIIYIIHNTVCSFFKLLTGVKVAF